MSNRSSEPASLMIDRRLQAFIETCLDVAKKLASSHDAASIDPLIELLDHQIHDVERLVTKPLPRSTVKRHAPALETAAVDLWNLCTRLRRDSEDVSPNTLALPNRLPLFARSRALAFALLDLARQVVEEGQILKEPSDIAALLHLALKAARGCIETALFPLALLILRKAAEYIQALRASGTVEFTAVETDYYVLRTALSWKENRLDVAEHMFTKTEDLRKSLSPQNAESFADTMFEIGKDLLHQEDMPMAIKWLDRALDLLHGQDLEQLSRHGIELRLSIYHALVQALTGVGTPEFLEKADDLVTFLASEMGEKPVVLYLQLTLLQKRPDAQFDTDAYASILRRMMRSFDCCDSQLRFLARHVRILNGKDSTRAAALLDEVLLSRVLQSGEEAWIDKILMLRLWIATSQAENLEKDESLFVLEQVLSKIADNVNKILCAETASAALALIWPKIESTFGQSQFDRADGWCNIALHRVFQTLGPLNKAKLQRKRILCASSLKDPDRAKTIFLSMSQSIQDDPATRYLMYKTALQSWDHAFASECLEIMCKADNCQEYLYACIHAAQQWQDKICAVEAMKKLVESYELLPMAEIHIPALLRSTIRLMLSLYDDFAGDGDVDLEVVAKDICQVFDAAVHAVGQDYRDVARTKVFTVAELVWFSDNSYNIAVKNCDGWDPRYLARLFQACLYFNEVLPPDVPQVESRKAREKALRSHFCVAASLVAAARSDDSVEQQLQQYLAVRRHVKAFESELESDRGYDQSSDEFTSKLSFLMVFDFEAAIALKQWTELGEIARKTAICRDAKSYLAMADCLLRSNAPVEALFPTMKCIVNGVWTLEHFGLEKLSKYLRCLLQTVLPLNPAMGLQVVVQACELAMEASNTTQRFPPEELEWIVTVAFNRAVDFYGAGEDDDCKGWATKAMELAHYCPDDGKLERALHDRYLLLKWS